MLMYWIYDTLWLYFGYNTLANDMMDGKKVMEVLDAARSLPVLRGNTAHYKIYWKGVRTCFIVGVRVTCFIVRGVYMFYRVCA